MSIRAPGNLCAEQLRRRRSFPHVACISPVSADKLLLLSGHFVRKTALASTLTDTADSMIYESPFDNVHLPECTVWDKGACCRTLTRQNNPHL